jgi:hypothetical protein
MDYRKQLYSGDHVYLRFTFTKYNINFSNLYDTFINGNESHIRFLILTNHSNFTDASVHRVV